MVKTCIKCNFTGEEEKFIKTRNICKGCSLKKLEKYRPTYSKESKEKYNNYHKNYFHKMTEEQREKRRERHRRYYKNLTKEQKRNIYLKQKERKRIKK